MFFFAFLFVACAAFGSGRAALLDFLDSFFLLFCGVGTGFSVQLLLVPVSALAPRFFVSLGKDAFFGMPC